MDGLIGSVVGDSTRNKTTTESLEGDWDTATEEMRILRSEELFRGMSCNGVRTQRIPGNDRSDPFLD